MAEEKTLRDYALEQAQQLGADTLISGKAHPLGCQEFFLAIGLERRDDFLGFVTQNGSDTPQYVVIDEQNNWTFVYELEENISGQDKLSSPEQANENMS